jgi:outer membrane autotransporter protein
LAHTWHSVDTAREATFIGERLTSNAKAGTTQAFGEAGYAIQTGALTLEPFANLAYVKLRTDGFTEKGGNAALKANGQSSDTTFSTLGLRVQGDLSEGIKANAALGWRHAFGDTTPQARVAFAGGGEAFTVSGVPIAKNAAAIELGLQMAVSKDATLGLSYSGQFGSGIRDNGVKLGLNVRF